MLLPRFWKSLMNLIFWWAQLIAKKARRNKKARGFDNKERTEGYICTGRIIQRLMKLFPAARSIVETTEVTLGNGVAWRQTTEQLQEYYIRPLAFDKVQATACLTLVIRRALVVLRA